MIMGFFKKDKSVDTFGATEVILKDKIEINMDTRQCRVNKNGFGKLDKRSEKIFNLDDIVSYEFDYIQMKDKASRPVIKFVINDFETPVIHVKVDDYIGLKPKEYKVDSIMFTSYVTLGERAIARLNMLLGK